MNRNIIFLTKSIERNLLALLPIPIITIPLLNTDLSQDVIAIITISVSVILLSISLRGGKKKITPASTHAKPLTHRIRPFTQDVFHYKRIDALNLGAIASEGDEHDLLSSSQIEKLASKIYEECKK